ncbi:MAG: DUF1998 domain-containing protein [Acidimicrobiaceae bacterium]|nr:DUF1998 domain-containing protein [Acidimicrobiaceae bacterium]
MSPPRSRKGAYQSRRVGGVRPSQMIHTYGPGAVVDLPGLSVVLAGTDMWDINHSERVIEPRLLGTVRALPGCHLVAEFRTPPWQEETSTPFDDWARIGVPVHPFPRWLRCTGCDLLSPVDRKRFQLDVPVYRPDRARYFHDRCKGRRPSAVPARFFVACMAGHLDDFPWDEFVHRGGQCPNGGPILELKEAGKASRATDVRVVCKTCGVNRLVQDAFGSDPEPHLPRCRGRHPHLQRFDPECAQPTRALLLGASNAWFAVYRSALTIPTVTGDIEQKVVEHWDDLHDIEDRTEFDVIVKRLKKGSGEKPLRWVLRWDADDVWTAIDDHRGGNKDDIGIDDLRGPEWEAFTAAVPPNSDDFRVRALEIPSGFKKTLDHPIAVDRLREVQALCGFTRIDSPDAGDPDRIAPIWNGDQSWLPAAEVRGEGILVRLPEARVEQWEKDYRTSSRYRDLAQATRNWRARRGLDPAEGIKPARFVLLHTLSHLLVHQVALDCGYSAASIRERLYCRESGDPEGPPMAGVLLYTASPDSEGTLGGLVALCEPNRLAGVLRDAVSRAKLCSTDPMCADHRAGEIGDSLHNSACHACLFAPETSCEVGNRYLDRGAVVPILGDPDNAYFT